MKVLRARKYLDLDRYREAVRRITETFEYLEKDTAELCGTHRAAYTAAHNAIFDLMIVAGDLLGEAESAAFPKKRKKP